MLSRFIDHMTYTHTVNGTGLLIKQTHMDQRSVTTVIIHADISLYHI